MSNYYLSTLPGRKVKVVSRDPLHNKNLNSDTQHSEVENCNTNNIARELEEKKQKKTKVKEFLQQAPQGDCQSKELSSENKNWEEEDYLPLP